MIDRYAAPQPIAMIRPILRRMGGRFLLDIAVRELAIVSELLASGNVNEFSSVDACADCWGCRANGTSSTDLKFNGLSAIGPTEQTAAKSTAMKSLSTCIRFSNRATHGPHSASVLVLLRKVQNDYSRNCDSFVK